MIPEAVEGDRKTTGLLSRLPPGPESADHFLRTMVRIKCTQSQDRDLHRLYSWLREHLGATAAFMKISRDYRDLIEKMDAHYPRATRGAAPASQAGPDAEL